MNQITYGEMSDKKIIKDIDDNQYIYILEYTHLLYIHPLVQLIKRTQVSLHTYERRWCEALVYILHFLFKGFKK